MTSILRFEAIGKDFALPAGTRTILANVNLDVGEGEVVALVGRSGSGKSTLLNIAAGLVEPSSGHLTLRHGARLGYVFQDPRLLPWLTVEDNLKLISPPDLHARIPTWLARVGLAGRELDRPGQLSLGMAQRASLARALLIGPDVLLLDEPFGSLDELTASELRVELATLLSEEGKTALLVTHNPGEAVFLADRVIILGGSPGGIQCQVDVLARWPRPRTAEDPRRWELSQEILRRLKEGDR